MDLHLFQLGLARTHDRDLQQNEGQLDKVRGWFFVAIVSFVLSVAALGIGVIGYDDGMSAPEDQIEAGDVEHTPADDIDQYPPIPDVGPFDSTIADKGGGAHYRDSAN